MNVVCNPSLIVVAGQSNAVGMATEDMLPDDLEGPINGARIFTKTTGGTNWSTYTWQNLQFGVSNNGTTGAADPWLFHFGIELRLMKLLTSHYGVNFNLLKVAQGGIPLHQTSSDPDWSPSSTDEYYDISNGYESAGIAALTNHLPPAAYIWIQGENDARSDWSGEYETLLTNFISEKRSDRGLADMPFVICRLGNLQTAINTTQRNIIRSAQENVCANVPNCYLVDMDGLATQDDNVHYIGASYDTAAQRIFEVLKNVIPIAIFKIIVPIDSVSFTACGVNESNTEIIYEVGTPNKSFVPGRSINPLTGFTSGKGYYAKICEILKLTRWIY